MYTMTQRDNQSARYSGNMRTTLKYSSIFNVLLITDDDLSLQDHSFSIPCRDGRQTQVSLNKFGTGAELTGAT